jgi:hypothetical protein
MPVNVNVSPLSGESFGDIDGDEHLRPLLALRGWKGDQAKSQSIWMMANQIPATAYGICSSSSLLLTTSPCASSCPTSQGISHTRLLDYSTALFRSVVD